MIDLIDALDDPNLFGPWFSGPSWRPWRAVLKAACGHALDDDDLAIFRAVAQRDPPRRRVRELWAVAGRRAGKDSIASAIAAHAAGFVDYSPVLRPGEKASVLCLAVDRTQAKIALGYARAYFARIPMLKELVTRETADGLELATLADLSVIASNFRTVRGRAIALAILDECAFFRDESSAAPDVETYTALVPGMATVPNSLMVGMSSPYRKAGLLYTKWKDHFAKPGDDVLVIQAPSRALNPTLPQRLVDEAMERDPAAARAEWLGEWRDDISGYIARELVEAAVDRGVTVRPRAEGKQHFAFVDASGGVHDSYTAAVAHAEGDKVILDCLVEIRAPFNPTVATATVAETIKSYGLRECTGDRYSAGWVVEAFAANEIAYRHSDRDRSAIYADALPLFTSGRARLLDNPRLVTQFANLERRTSSTGRDRIDHPANGGADDASNSAAGALTMACGKSEPSFIAFYSAMLGMADETAWAARPVQVRLLAPVGCGAVKTLSGRDIVIPADHIIEVDEDDAKPLRGAGFTDLKKDAA